MNQLGKLGAGLLLTSLFCSCGHTKVCQIGLLSVGDLDARTIPSKVEGPVLVGKDGCKGGPGAYYLSEAVRNALKGTQCDTLVDAEVTTRTGLLVWNNEVEVKGTGIDSKTLPKDGGVK